MRGAGAILAALLVLASGLGPASASAGRDTPEALRAEAFEAAQWAMTSEAAEALAQVSARFAQGDDEIGRLADRREALMTRRDALERETQRLYGLDGPDAARQRELSRADLAAVMASLRAVDEEIARRFPAYGELTSPSALTVEEVQALLGPDEALLLVLVNPEAAYVWAVTSETVAWARAPQLGEAAMAQAVARLRASLTTEASRGNPYLSEADRAALEAPAFDRALAHSLYAQLIAPVEPALAGRSTLITVTSGALATLPLATLVTESPTGADGGPAALADTAWLVDRYALASLPAVSSLRALRCWLVRDPARRSPACPALDGEGARLVATPEAGSLVAFGAPSLTGRVEPTARGAVQTQGLFTQGRADVEALRGLPALPGSRAELEALGALIPGAVVHLGDAATETAVRREASALLARARYVVFSTHGLMAGEMEAAAEPGLVLTPPPVATAEDDGYLSASEAAQLRLNADFVVLSACNTAASDGSPGGEGLSGLARAFFYAGARSVLVSHWAVSDRATTRLITETFAGLDDADIGQRAQALRAAMLSVRSNPAWAHPAYWSAFTLVGDPA